MAQVEGTYILDFVHNNPGEKPYVTKYNDPYFLKSQGFNGTVTHWYVNCAITYDNYKRGLINNSEELKWINQKADEIDKKLAEFKKAGIKVYPFTDFIVFPKSIWDKYGKEIQGKGVVEGTGGLDSRAKKPDLSKPRTQQLLKAQIDAIFTRFSELDGLTLRFGETYLHDTPYHMGGSPISKDAIADHVLLLKILREQVCVKWNKKLFYRTWDFGYNFHNNPEFYLAVTNQIEPHPNLIFSIKYQQDDYHRMTPFNPTLGIGHHQQIVESQSRMEAYGKGAHPYYTSKGVIEGWPETKYEIEFGTHRFTGKLNSPNNPRGVKDVLSSNLIRGVMTWSNGGGWQGPYITHEIWTDLNTYVVANWMKKPSKTEEQLFKQFTQLIGLDEMNADRFRQMAILSIEAVRKGQLNSYVQNKVWWSRDEFFSASENEPVLKEIFQYGLEDRFLAEKDEAVSMWREIEAVSKQFECADKDIQEAVRISCSYGRIKYQLIQQMWKLMIEDYQLRNWNELDTKSVACAIQKYDELWQEWRRLKNSSRFCATLYTDEAFRNQKEGSIGELVNKLRKIIN